MALLSQGRTPGDSAEVSGSESFISGLLKYDNNLKTIWGSSENDESMIKL